MVKSGGSRYGYWLSPHPHRMSDTWIAATMRATRQAPRARAASAMIAAAAVSPCSGMAHLAKIRPLRTSGA